MALSSKLEAGEQVLWSSHPSFLPAVGSLVMYVIVFFIISVSIPNFSRVLGMAPVFLLALGCFFLAWIPFFLTLTTTYTITSKRILTSKLFSFSSYDIRPSTKFSFQKVPFCETLIFDQEVAQKFVNIPNAEKAKMALDKVIASLKS